MRALVTSWSYIEASEVSAALLIAASERLISSTCPKLAASPSIWSICSVK